MADKLIEVNPIVHLEARPGDIILTPAQLQSLSFFKRVKDPRRLPKFQELPGAVMLRFYQAGEEIWRQGETGFTAFYILTPDDLKELGATLLPENWQLPDSGAGPVEVASVHLAVARKTEAKPPARSFWDWLWGTPAKGPAPAAAAPLYIPFDGPTEVDYETLQATMYAGELFGEAGCLEGQPRSATVVARRNWFMLEMVRNILTDVQRDDGYKKYMDELYKNRGLGIHLRKFSIFRELGDAEFQKVVEQAVASLGEAEKKSPADKAKPQAPRLVETVAFKHGQVICDEHDYPDSMYIIRSGLVQVIKNVSPLLGRDDVPDWPRWCAALVAGGEKTDHLTGTLWQRLAAFHDELRRCAKGESLDAARQQEFLYVVNDILKGPALTDNPAKAGLVHPGADLAAELKEAKKNPRRFNRLILEALYPGLIRPRGSGAAPELILAYRARGETIGEMGLIRRRPRSATCVAYTHRDSKREDVVLLRIRAELFGQLAKPGSQLDKALEQIVQAREQSDVRVLAEMARDPRLAPVPSKRFDELNLIQGQKLMLIDLDRCTRCDECVQACVATHGDGRSRLFLDGPRYDHQTGGTVRHFLVPSTCRSCLNPECMMSCPVGSIHRGNQGQIVIEDWCIGCQQCAKNCPYGAIQMHDVGLVPRGAFGWHYAPAGRVCDPEWFRPAFRDHSWALGQTPFHTSDILDLSGPQSQGKPENWFFRFRFSVKEDWQENLVFHFTVRTDVPLTAWLNGTQIDLEPHKYSKKEDWNLETNLVPAGPKGPCLIQGTNVLAISLIPAGKQAEVLLDAGLYTIPPPKVPQGQSGTFQGTLVSSQAVVCDLCSTLPDGPACVKACPHDATRRVDARSGIPAW